MVPGCFHSLLKEALTIILQMAAICQAAHQCVVPKIYLS